MQRRFDTSEWTQVSERREDRVNYSDWTDEDTGFSEVIALENKAPAQQQQASFDWRRPRTWLEWTDKRGKLRSDILDYIHIHSTYLIAGPKHAWSMKK
jgi:hypothetical protein